MNFLELTWWESDNKHLYSEQFKLQLVRWGCYQGVEIIYSGGNGEWKIITSQMDMDIEKQPPRHVL